MNSRTTAALRSPHAPASRAPSSTLSATPEPGGGGGGESFFLRRGSVISAADYQLESSRVRKAVEAAALARAALVRSASARAEQARFGAWAGVAVRAWQSGVPRAIGRALADAMRAGRDVAGAPSRAAPDGLALDRRRGGLLLRYARVGPPASAPAATAAAAVPVAERSAYVDVSGWPGVPEDAFAWAGRPLADGAPFSFHPPGEDEPVVARRARVLELLDVAAAAAGLEPVSLALAAAFPGFSIEMGPVEGEGILALRVFIHDDAAAATAAAADAAALARSGSGARGGAPGSTSPAGRRAGGGRAAASSPPAAAARATP